MGYPICVPLLRGYGDQITGHRRLAPNHRPPILRVPSQPPRLRCGGSIPGGVGRTEVIGNGRYREYLCVRKVRLQARLRIDALLAILFALPQVPRLLVDLQGGRRASGARGPERPRAAHWARRCPHFHVKDKFALYNDVTEGSRILHRPASLVEMDVGEPTNQLTS